MSALGVVTFNKSCLDPYLGELETNRRAAEVEQARQKALMDAAAEAKRLAKLEQDHRLAVQAAADEEALKRKAAEDARWQAIKEAETSNHGGAVAGLVILGLLVEAVLTLWVLKEELRLAETRLFKKISGTACYKKVCQRKPKKSDDTDESEKRGRRYRR